MNARIIKETRAVAPVFGLILLGVIVPPLLWNRDVALVVGNFMFTICCLLLGASCFGNEYQWRTMPLLLSQPVPRRKLWNEKMFVLAVALLLGLLTYLACIPLDSDSRWFAILMCVCVFCTAAYTALEVKNTLLAAIMIVGIPLALAGMLACLFWVIDQLLHTDFGIGIGHRIGSYLQKNSPTTGIFLEDAMENHPYFWLCTATTIYCAVLYRAGYVKFMKLQAIDAQSREVALPTKIEAFLGRSLKGLLPGYSGPWTSLFRKELQVQKAGFLVAGVGCIVSILAGLAWDVHNSEILMGVALAPVAILVFVIPLITPGTCVAEERNWGVGEWQRALPASARQQWVAKLLTVFFTCALLGVALPALMWFFEGWVLRLPNGVEHWHSGSGQPSNGGDMRALLVYALIYCLMCSLGVFTSSASRSTIKAILMTLGLMLAAGAVAAIIAPMLAKGILYITGIPHYAAYHEINVLWWADAALLVLLGLVHFLAYANYRKGEPGTGWFWGQMALVAGSIGTAVAILVALQG